MSANTTPDATATPRTDHECDDYAGPLCWIGGTQFIPADFARTLETELTAAQAALAEANREAEAQGEHAVAMTEFAQSLQVRAERAEAELRERTQWQCKCGGTDCAGQAENERLRAEVTKLKAHEGDLVIGAAILEGARKQEAREVDQLRARVAALEWAITDAIKEARALNENTDPLVDRILQPALDGGKGTP